MTWIEQTALRARKAKHYRDDATGQMMAILTIHDQHYKDGADTWQDVNENLVDDGLDGYAKKCDTTAHILRVGSAGTRRWYPRRNITTEYVNITGIEYYSTRWRTLNLPTPVWRNQGAEWDMTNLYASVTNTWRRIKTDFILKDNSAPTRIRFAIELVGLTLDASTWKLTSTTDSAVVGTIDLPTAQDANNNSVAVAATYTGGYIEWAVTPGSAVYPITVDPTFTDGEGGTTNSSKDAYVDGGAATTNYGSSNTLMLANGDGSANRTALFGFDLSSISASATCTSATLYNYKRMVDNTYTVNFYQMASGNSGWTEAGCTWNKLDGTNNWAGGNTGCRTADTDYINSILGSSQFANADGYDAEKTASLTASVVQGAFSGAFNLIGFTTANLWNTCWLQSSDQTNTAARPKLVVVYSSASNVNITMAEGSQGQSSDTASPSFSGLRYTSYWKTQYATDQEVYATLGTVAGNMRLWGRMVNPTGYGANLRGYYACYGGGSVTAYRYNDATTTNLQLGSASVTLADGDKLALRLVDDSVQVYTYQSSTWTQRITVTDPSPALEAGYIGMDADNAGAAFDDFGGGAIRVTINPAENSQGQSSDLISASFSLSGVNVSASENSQTQTSDTVNLTVIAKPAMVENTQAQVSDLVSASYFAPVYNVTMTEDTQAQSSDLITLKAVYPVSLAENTQSQTSDLISASTGVVFNISALENTQSQASDTATPKVVTPASLTENTQAQSSDLVALTVIAAVTMTEGNQGQSSDLISASSGYQVNISAAENSQSQASDTASFTVITKVTMTEGAQSQASDLVTTSSGAPTYNVTAVKNSQGQVSDLATVKVVYPVALEENSQGQTSDTASLTVITKITMTEGAQTQSSDTLTAQAYAPTYQISLVEGWQSQVSDLITPRPVYLLAMTEGYQAQTYDALSVTIPVEIIALVALTVQAREYEVSVQARDIGLAVSGREYELVTQGRDDDLTVQAREYQLEVTDR